LRRPGGCSAGSDAAARYRNDPDTDNHDMMTRMIYGAEVDTWDKAKYKRMRGFCKEIYLGKCYGMGGAKLCRKLKLPTRWAVFWQDRRKARSFFETRGEAQQAAGFEGDVWEVAGLVGQAILDKFDGEAPFVKGIARVAEDRAKANGFITTVLGRRCRFTVLEDGTFDWTHKALNRLIQGCSADQTKQAMVDLDAAGFPVQLQVHDEICFTAESKEQAIAAAKVMRDCVPANVPFKVDVEVGPSWGEAA
jgi:DNA polymerase I-like protein with 3'-5' exonuclease and polymerase domains